MTGARRFSQAISEGDGISVVALVDGPDAAQRAEADGAEGVLVHSGHATELGPISEAISVPVLYYWNGEEADRLLGADACVVDLATSSGEGDSQAVVEQAHAELDDHFELALRVEDEEQLENALETLRSRAPRPRRQATSKRSRACSTSCRTSLRASSRSRTCRR